MLLDDLPHPFVRSEALSAGVTDRRLGLALRRRDLERIAPGVYASAASWGGWSAWQRHRALAATARRVTPDAILSHTSAAALLDLPMPPRPPLRATLTLLDDPRTSRDDCWRDFHRGHTPPGQIVIRRGAPELVPARTVLDALRVLRPRDGLAVLDGALRRGVVRPKDLRAMRRHQRHWPGVTRFDATSALADGRRESWLESASAWVMSSWEVPPPVPQVIVLDRHGRFVARVDALWADFGVVGEADGVAKYALGGADDNHAAARRAAAQLSREDRLRDLGLGVVRWGSADLDGPLTLRDRVLRALERGDPTRVTARFRCSCCQRLLTDCAEPTRMTPSGVGGSQSVA